MKKIFFTFLFLIFTLSSCFWGEWDWLNLYDKAKDFSIRVPKDWEIIQNKDWILPKPRSWDIELAVSSKTEKDNFFNNLLVLSEKLLIDSSASEYITSANLNSENEYFEKKKI